jgi:lipopolysaccharide/colanic/teichoic acid biosynthesis glycosyltransferase
VKTESCHNGGRVQPLEIEGFAVLPVGSVPAPTSGYMRFVKPLIDWVLALALLVALLPALLGAMGLIAVTMGRPVIFRQSRIGANGRYFTLYKLRTMRDDPEYAAASLRPDELGRIRHKRPDDPRITPAGRVLRRWNFDELPQLVNVLLGHMSLVGPRPELPEIVAHYEPWQHRRHTVKPGITGLWQVSARNGKPMHECTQIDLAYVDQVGLLADFRLLLWTIPAAFGHQRGF